MEVKAVRRVNLRALITQHGTIRALAKAVGGSESYLSQLVSERINASMGDALARQIEQRLGLELGWMDESHAPGGGSARWLEVRRLSGERMQNTNNNGNTIAAPVPVSAAAYCSEMTSSAMAPGIVAGDLLIIEPDVMPEPGRVVVCTAAEAPEPVVRRLELDGGRMLLRADASGYPVLALRDLADVFGVVVAVVKRL